MHGSTRSKHWTAPHRTRWLAGALAIVATISACSDGRSPSRSSTRPTPLAAALPRPKLAAIADRYRVDCQSPGAAIGVRLRDGGTKIVTAGELAPGISLKPRSEYLAGSVTKLFVATVALQLIRTGRLHLDDPVAEFLPEWPRAEQITVEMLLGHRSGMADFGNDFSPRLRDLVLADLARVFTYREVLDLVAEQPPLFDPGAAYHYTNANYIVLGAILQQILDTTLGKAMRGRIIKPLGLADTFYGPDELGALRRADLHGLYDVSGTGNPIDIGDFPREAAITVDPAGAGIVSTLPDLLVFTQALYGTNQLLSRHSRELLSRTANTLTTASLGLAAPFDIRGHAGVSPGAQTMAAYDRTTDTTVVTWCNRLDAGAQASVPTLVATKLTFELAAVPRKR